MRKIFHGADAAILNCIVMSYLYVISTIFHLLKKSVNTTECLLWVHTSGYLCITHSVDF